MEYMQAFWKMYRIELGVNFFTFTSTSYLVTSLIIGKFRGSILRVLLVPSIATALSGMYLRRVTMA